MNKTTHLLGALLGALLVVLYFPPPNIFIFIFSVSLATYIVDIDTTKSTLGRKILPLSWILELFTKHRGIVHSVWIPLILYLPIKQFSVNAAYGFSLGYVIHLILDSLTVQGITPFYPLKNRIKGPFRTGSWSEHVVQGAIIAAILFLLFKL